MWTVDLTAAQGGDQVLPTIASPGRRGPRVSLGSTGPGRPTRFAQLATVRGHAAHAAAADPTADPAALAARRDRRVQDLVAAHPPLGHPAEVGWFTALDDDLVARRATVHRNLVDARPACGVRIATITPALMAQATDAPDRVEFEDAWQQGSRLTLDVLGVTVVERTPLRPG